MHPYRKYLWKINKDWNHITVNAAKENEQMLPEIIEQVGSKNIKAYVDFRNTANAGYDVLKEVKQLGKNNFANCI